MLAKSLINFLLLVSFSAHAQEQKKVLLTDKFKGNIDVGGDSYATTTLSLQHEPYADMGTFTLDEYYPGTQFEKPAHNITPGDWTVLKGSAADENATVVELDARKGGRVLYFLRLKNGSLQQLDMSLHEIAPVSKHMLKKQ
jgi:hypothetical protein